MAELFRLALSWTPWGRQQPSLARHSPALFFVAGARPANDRAEQASPLSWRKCGGSAGWLIERHGEMAIRTTTAVSLALAAMGTCAAGAEDAIKTGNWEYSITTPGITHLPPGMQPSPEMRLEPEGLTFIRTRCVTATDPFPPMPEGEGKPCTMDKTGINGGIVSWSLTCVTPKTTVHADWILHYHGETMDGQVAVSFTYPDHCAHRKYKADKRSLSRSLRR
jgi:hypothetical protein